MTKLYFRNTSTSSLITVGRVALPQTSYTPQSKVAVKLPNDTLKALLYEKSIGDISHIFTFKYTFEPGLKQFVMAPGSPELEAAEGEFIFSPWILKDPLGTILRVQITDSSNNTSQLPIAKLDHINGTNHVQSFRIESPVVKGWRMVQFLTVFSELDHVEFKLALNWHDRAIPQSNTLVKKLVIKTKDQLLITYGRQMGIQSIYNAMADEWTTTIIPSNQDIADGQGLEIRGMVLTMPETYLPGVPVPGMNLQELNKRIANLNAVKLGQERYGWVGQVWGVSPELNDGGNWFNSYLPSSVPGTPVVAFNPIQGVGIFADRAEGLFKFPGSTGAQTDFGADKGYLATVFHDPGFIPYYQGSLIDRMRNFNVHEPDGSRVRRENHPGRKTWSMVTFPVLSTDFLGKNPDLPSTDGNGWFSYDTQHRSQNGQLTYLALTGDELELETMLNAYEADRAQAYYRLADREVGRTFTVWAKQLRLIPQNLRQELLQHINERLQFFFEYWRGRLLQNNTDPNRKVIVSDVIQDPRSYIENPVTGQIEPSWICYQHAQMISGLYTLLNELSRYGSPHLDSLRVALKKLCYTYLWYGVFKQSGVWRPVLFARYRTGLPSGQYMDWDHLSPEEGIPLDPSAYSTTSWEISLDEGNNGWWNWVGPAIAISYILLEDQLSKERAAEILHQVFSTGFWNVESAEWFPVPLP